MSSASLSVTDELNLLTFPRHTIMSKVLKAHVGEHLVSRLVIKHLSSDSDSICSADPEAFQESHAQDCPQITPNSPVNCPPTSAAIKVTDAVTGIPVVSIPSLDVDATPPRHTDYLAKILRILHSDIASLQLQVQPPSDAEKVDLPAPAAISAELVTILSGMQEITRKARFENAYPNTRVSSEETDNLDLLEALDLYSQWRQIRLQPQPQPQPPHLNHAAINCPTGNPGGAEEAEEAEAEAVGD